MHFRCKSFVRHLYCECALPFHSHNGVFGRIELLNFNMKPLINFSSIVITYILFNIFFPSSISPKPPSIFPRSFIFNLSQWDVKSIRNWVLWMAFKPISSLMQVAREPSTVCWREPSPPHCPSEVLLFWIRHVHGFVLLVNWSIPNFPNKKWFFFFWSIHSLHRYKFMKREEFSVMEKKWDWIWSLLVVLWIFRESRNNSVLRNVAIFTSWESVTRS